ncbi:hypothetical protein AMIS_20090 [Actinoplanes missouriensis 431]|uniref:Uncharacterized protein n=1 Tax=Actinoplanes missouriensis (strain ATCC 14538 / DSM 43046 / CBS 188.64 / JCM 3121 / NBRC 102363 / NCIMB 12654 / NRRL B-3342 / UNCC 431) TaxID=512565 RepID=I0H2J2_ACTM4|nr:hypothetical protein [Actinoplanes missouriensis]BAL87229.1 hypothetical protein AMIS_20090 [Actinoplanes missouriensis 431]
MPHSEQTTAVLTANEPPNGTVLVVENGDTARVIKRDDGLAYACYRSEPGGHVWFNLADSDGDPLTLHNHIQYATAVYALGEKLAEFR